MNRIENGTHETQGLSTETRNFFLMHFGLWGEVLKALKVLKAVGGVIKNSLYLRHYEVV